MSKAGDDGLRLRRAARKRIDHADGTVLLPIRKILGVESFCSGSVTGLDDQGIPERDSVPLFKVKGLHNGVASVHNDLPGQVVGDDIRVSFTSRGLPAFRRRFTQSS